MSPHFLLVFAALLVLPGCLATQSGSLEVLNPKQAYGRSVAILADIHRENDATEKRLASDLQAAMAKRGLIVHNNPEKADLVVIPTLGRMREKSASPVAPVEKSVPEDEDAPVAASDPVIAAPAPETRPFNRFSGGNILTRSDLVSRRAVPSARVPAGAQQAGLLLTAYRSEDFLDYGVGRQSLPPVWRIYVSQPAVRLRWDTVAVPLINAAAGAARPLAAEPQSRVAGNGSPEKKKKDQKSGRQMQEGTEQKSRVGRTTEQDTEKQPSASAPSREASARTFGGSTGPTE